MNHFQHFSKLLLVLIVSLTGFQSLAQCNANAGPNRTKCAGAPVNLGGGTPASGNAPFTYSWSPATDLSCTNCPNPICTATVNTTYTLTITDDDGCTDSDNVNVIISGGPIANFTFAPNNACANLPVQFTSTSTGSGLTYDWDFGNPASGGSNSSSQQNPIHEFISTGAGTQTFPVTLTVTNAAGCVSSITQNVTVSQTPAALLIDPITLFKNCDGSNFNITVYDGTPNPGTNYTIVWGDGSPNFTGSPFPGSGVSHLYSTSDIFDLLYIVEGTNGCADTMTQLVSNITNPAIGAANPGATTGCGPMTLCFPLSNYATNHSSTTYEVNYGDGSPIVILPHPPPAVICHTYTTSSCGQPGNAFTFIMKAVNSCDSSLASISPIRVYGGPQANFTASPSTQCVNTPITFLNTSVLGFNSSCTASTVFNWNFGDGQTLTTVTLTNPVHVYTLPGTYTVTLSTTNSCGTTTLSQNVCIEAPPVPNFTITPAIACVPFNAAVTNLSPSINSCNTTSVWSVIFNGSTCLPSAGTWNFINSTNATSLNPEFEFIGPGQYTVRLTMTNSCGTFIYDQIVIGQAPPQITLASLPTICAGESVNPSAVVNDCYEPADSYSWTFTGGLPSNSSLLIPGSVQYVNAGTYSVQLVVVNLCGSVSATTPVVVNSPPIANAGPDIAFCSGGNGIIGSPPVGGVTYAWSPTLGLSSSSNANPSVTLTNATALPIVNQYVVTASSSPTCFTRDTVLVTVNPIPILIVNSPTICIGASTPLNVSGAGVGGNYSWSPATALSCTNCFDPTANPVTTTTYTISGTSAFGCISTVNSTVTVNPLPIVAAGPDLSLCDQPIPVTLNGTPAGGVWSGSPNVSAGGIFTPNGVEIVTLTYTYTDPTTLCVNSDDLVVTIDPAVIPTVDPIYTLCANDASINLTTSLNANPTGGIWSGTGVTNPNFNPAVAGVGTHTVTYTFGTGTCLTTASSDITVNPVPTISVNSETICNGENISLVASGAGIGGDYNWSPATALNCTNCFDPTANPTSTIVYTVSGTTSLGCINSAVSTVTVNPLPLVNAGPDLVLCDQPIPAIINGTPIGGTWIGSANVTSAGVFTPNGPEVSTLYYTYVDPTTLCVNVDSMIVTVSAPIVPLVDPAFSMCENEPIINLSTTLNANPLGGTWSGTGVTTPNFNPAVAGVGTHTLTYTYGSGTCLTTATSDITVNPTPIILASSGTICVGETVAISASGAGPGGTYNWTPATALSCTNCFDPIANPTSTTVYSVAGTTVFGCINSTTSTVTVNPLPVVNAGPDMTLCDQPIPVNLIGTPIGGTWSGSANVSAGGVFTPNGPEISTLYYTYTVPATGCLNIDSMVMTVSPPVIPIIDPTYSICVNDPSVNLNLALNPSQLGGTWSGVGVTNPNFNPTTAGVGTHTISYSYGAGTCLNVVNSTITVNSQPTISVNSGVICVGQSINLSASGAGIGGDYNWSPATALSCTNCFDPIANPTATIVYSVSGTTVFGCINTTTSTVTVNPLPIVNAGLDMTLCDQPIPVTLTGTPIGGTWSGSANVSAGGVFTPNGSEISTLYYTYSIPATGCINVDSMVMTVVPPVIPTIDPTYSICVNEPQVDLNLVLNPSQLGGTWSGTGVTNPNFNPTTAGVGTHIVSYTYGSGTCLNVVTSAITINPQPTISVNSGVICDGQSINLVASGAGAGGNYNWSPTTALSCTNCFDPTANPTTSITYTVSGTTVFGCSNSANSTVTVNPLPIVNAGVDTTLCDLPSSVQLFGTPAGGVWSGTNINASGLFTPAGIGSFPVDYTYTLATGCSATDTRIIQVVAPQIADAGLDLEFCIDVPAVSLSGLPPGGTWSGTNITSAGIYTITNAGTFQMTYSIGAGNCFTSDIMDLTIHPLPAVVVGPDVDFCFSDAATNFTANLSGGTWTGTGISDALNGTFDPSIAGVGLHTIVYTFTDPITTCVNSDTLIVDVHPLPVVSFTFNPIVCTGTPELFNNTSTFLNTTVWDFGDGNSSVVNSPSNAYATIGTYNVQAIVTSPFGCIDSLTQSIEVREPPVADFTLAPDSACGPLTVSFNNQSTGLGMTYAWDFGNGQTSVQQNPANMTYFASYIADTTYYVVLDVTNMCGTVSHTETVVVMPTPTAIFGPDFDSGCSPFTANFASTSLGLPDSYFWDFGNGVTSSTTDSLFQQIFTTGATPTDYTIMLVVFNECGQDTAYHTITALPNTVNAFFNTSATTSCFDLTVNFTQYTLGGTLYSWDFGDGTTSSQYSPSHVYPNPGTYTVSLFANDGCSYDTTSVTITVNEPPVVGFSVAPDSTCVNVPFDFTNLSQGAVSSVWDFGDGTTSNLTNPSHAYIASGDYTVTLTGTDLFNGCSATVTQTVHVSTNPVAQFLATPTNGCVPLTVQFTNQSTNSTYQTWDFGNGNTSALMNPSFTFTSPGVYTVQLIVENVNGCTDTVNQNITVYSLPVAAFTTSYNCTDPVTINFTNQTNGAINYSWDFGNGQSSSLTNPTETFTTPGNYTVQLTASNQYGCEHVYEEVITIFPLPTLTISANSVAECANVPITFSSLSSNVDSIVWNMGDGIFINDTDFDYIYSSNGNYSVSAIAYGSAGCTTQAFGQGSITIYPAVLADFDYLNVQNSTSDNGTIVFDNLSINADTYYWDFGGGAGSTEMNPSYTFGAAGSYSTTLIAANQYGCIDTAIMNVDVIFLNGLYLANAMYPGHSNYEVSHFVPKGVNLKEFELLIYDDWGNLIWSTTALDANGRPTEAWDGTYNGEPVQQDAYVWKVTAVFRDDAIWEGKEYGNKRFKKAGTVTVIR